MDDQQLRQLLEALKAFKNGDFTVRLGPSQPGIAGELAKAYNDLVWQTYFFGRELTRIAQELGPLGLFGGQMDVENLSGTWKDMADQVNLAEQVMTGYIRDMAHSVQNLVDNSSPRTMTIDVTGELRDLKNSVNQLVQKLSAAETTV
jgi:methyl-accepting chemotaxis protein